jgi:hypothetical protein
MTAWFFRSPSLESRNLLKSFSGKDSSFSKANLFCYPLNKESWKKSLFLKIGKISNLDS